MNLENIAGKISAIPINKIKKIHVACRPPEKSNVVLTVKINDHNWYCERPTYYWSTFDKSFVEIPYLDEQKIIYPNIKTPLAIFDKRGLFWTRDEMSSFGLLRYFLNHPQKYISVMTKHTTDVKNIMQDIAKQKNNWNKTKYLKINLAIIQASYYKFYRYHSSVFMLFDELAWQFRRLLLKYLTIEQVNSYFPQFLSGEATRLALKKGYVAERSALEYQPTRGVLYAMNLRPRLFYAAPKFKLHYSNNTKIANALYRAKITTKDLKNFLAFRKLVPVGYQINEEAQYAETAGLSAHLGVLIKLVYKKLNLSLDKIQKLSLEQIIAKL